MNNNYTVYMHKNKINGKKYVGITCRTLQARWKNGYGYKKHNKHFWNAIQKYGWDNFEHGVIAIHLTLEQAGKMEKMLIREWDLLDHSKGYNIAEGGSNGNNFAGKTEEEMQEFRQKISESKTGENHPMFGKHHSEEARKKISEASTGKKNPMYGKTGANCPNSIPVIAFTNSGSFHKEFAGTKDAERELGINQGSICKCVKGKRKSAGKIIINGKKEKLIWKYKEP